MKDIDKVAFSDTFEIFSCQMSQKVNNNSPKWRWIVVDIGSLRNHDGDGNGNVAEQKN